MECCNGLSVLYINLPNGLKEFKSSDVVFIDCERRPMCATSSQGSQEIGFTYRGKDGELICCAGRKNECPNCGQCPNNEGVV